MSQRHFLAERAPTAASMPDKQTETLRLVDAAGDVETWEYQATDDWIAAAADELRRLSALNAELVEALKEMLLQHGVRGGCGPSARARAALSKAEAQQ